MKNFNKILTGGLILFATTGLQADQVILDDLIVDGSTCVGQDCVNGESFGFDTIRLKENNLRIKFQDTSTTASFPSRDWQLTANDTSNGGANKFSIDDVDGGRTPFTIEAGAPSHSLYVDDGGRLGLGTSTPAVDVHTKSGNTPTLRLEQDGSSGFAAQTWDVAGNETNFFIRDATSGSTLPFRIFPGAPTSSISIEAGGDVGFGTTSPDKNLDIEDDGPAIRLTHTGTNASNWDILNNPATGRLSFSDDIDGVRVPFKFGQNSVNNLLRVGIVNTTTVSVGGDLAVSGNITATGTITPDYVFKSDYTLLSIEEHADTMWNNHHLPYVAAAKENEAGKGLINLGQRSQGLLEELEIAHIYIEQLHKRLTALESEQETLRDTVNLLLQKSSNDKILTSLE